MEALHILLPRGFYSAGFNIGYQGFTKGFSNIDYTTPFSMIFFRNAMVGGTFDAAFDYSIKFGWTNPLQKSNVQFGKDLLFGYYWNYMGTGIGPKFTKFEFIWFSGALLWIIN